MTPSLSMDVSASVVRLMAIALVMGLPSIAGNTAAAQQSETSETGAAARQAAVKLTLVHSHDKGSTVYFADFLPDGKRAVLGGDMTHPPIVLWDLEKNSVISELRAADDWHMSVAASPDGQRIVSSGLSGAIKVWNIESKTVEATFIHPGIVTGFAFSSDGLTLATSATDGTARLWNPQTGKKMHVLRGHESAVTGIALTPDGKQVVTCSADTTVRVWDASNGKLLHTLEHPEIVWSVAISPTGDTIVSGTGGTLVGPAADQIYKVSDDNTLRVWDRQTGALKQELLGHSHVVRRIAVSPNGRLAASGGLDATLRLWDLVSGKELDRSEGEGWVIAVDFSPDGQYVLAVGGVRKEGVNWIEAPVERARLFKLEPVDPED